ncbi:serine hydrolase domain-containing protein [Crocinitomix catalasitica]|uniref:serine hydrolase domain-containing protein n=1 Tax=Crocinitomix catalasitica TaxID=184607 RepID=UPI000688A42D|nr:serine hydrolase [Crocinitomix catalasitica]
MKKVLLLFIIAIFCLNCKKKPIFKGEAIEYTEDLTGSGFKSSQLDELTYTLDKDYNTTSMMILYNGKSIYEYGDTKAISYMASCRKSICSMLYGKYIDNGTIDLNETIGDLGIDEADGLLPIEKQATVRDVLMAKSGVFYEPANGGYDSKNAKPRGSVEPGDYFLYNNWDFNVAGHILELKSGNDIYQEIEDQLARPLGFQDWNIKNQSKSSTKKGKSQYPAYHIYISTRDMAKIGQLMLNKGVWKGQQLISNSWIDESTAIHTPSDTLLARYNNPDDQQFAYGYYWWLFANNDYSDLDGAYQADGYGGQYITIIPKRELVVVHKVKFPLLVSAGIKKGGSADVSGRQYNDLIHNLMKY